MKPAKKLKIDNFEEKTPFSSQTMQNLDKNSISSVSLFFEHHFSDRSFQSKILKSQRSMIHMFDEIKEVFCKTKKINEEETNNLKNILLKMEYHDDSFQYFQLSTIFDIYSNFLAQLNNFSREKKQILKFFSFVLMKFLEFLISILLKNPLKVEERLHLVNNGLSIEANTEIDLQINIDVKHFSNKIDLFSIKFKKISLTFKLNEKKCIEILINDYFQNLDKILIDNQGFQDQLITFNISADNNFLRIFSKNSIIWQYEKIAMKSQQVSMIVKSPYEGNELTFSLKIDKIEYISKNKNYSFFLFLQEIETQSTLYYSTLRRVFGLFHAHFCLFEISNDDKFMINVFLKFILKCLKTNKKIDFLKFLKEIGFFFEFHKDNIFFDQLFDVETTEILHQIGKQLIERSKKEEITIFLKIIYKTSNLFPETNLLKRDLFASMTANLLKVQVKISFPKKISYIYMFFKNLHNDSIEINNESHMFLVSEVIKTWVKATSKIIDQQVILLFAYFLSIEMPCKQCEEIIFQFIRRLKIGFSCFFSLALSDCLNLNTFFDFEKTHKLCKLPEKHSFLYSKSIKNWFCFEDIKTEEKSEITFKQINQSLFISAIVNVIRLTWNKSILINNEQSNILSPNQIFIKNESGPKDIKKNISQVIPLQIDTDEINKMFTFGGEKGKTLMTFFNKKR